MKVHGLFFVATALRWANAESEDYAGCPPGDAGGNCGTPTYGMGVSFPSLSLDFSCDKVGNDPIFGNVACERYQEYMRRCNGYFNKGGNRCTKGEQERVKKNVDLPNSVRKYTELGYKKMRAPPELMKAMKELLRIRHTLENGPKPEEWRLNTDCNHWQVQPRLIDIKKNNIPSLEAEGTSVREVAVETTKAAVKEWIGVDVENVMTYGLRVYLNGNMFTTHVNREIVTAEITIAQDLEEDWPFEFYGHDGIAHNITIRPGDMVLFETASLVHGRPFRMKGRYYVTLMVGFNPVGLPLNHTQDDPDWTPNFNETYKGKLTEFTNFPAYFLPGSHYAEQWKDLIGSQTPETRKRMRARHDAYLLEGDRVPLPQTEDSLPQAED